MKLFDTSEVADEFWLIYLFKAFHDEGKDEFIQYNSGCSLCYDNYYEYFLESLGYAAEMVRNDENIFKRHGYQEYDDEVNIYSFSSKEMQKYFKLARRLHRLEGARGENPYIEMVKDRAERDKNFYSYSFDYLFAKKRTAACLDILWGYDFSYDVLMVVWVMKVMRIFREELPKLKDKYRRVRREKRSIRNKRGGVRHAA